MSQSPLEAGTIKLFYFSHMPLRLGSVAIPFRSGDNQTNGGARGPPGLLPSQSPLEAGTIKHVGKWNHN